MFLALEVSVEIADRSPGSAGDVTDTVRVTDGLGGTADVTVTVTGSLVIAPATATLQPLDVLSFSATGGTNSYTFSLFVNN